MMTVTPIFFDSGLGHSTAFVGPTGQGKSMLSELTQAELVAMNRWSGEQPHKPGGAIDLMAWPGWSDVLARRVKDRFALGSKLT